MEYGLPIAVLLKRGTADVHEAAHRSEGAIRLLRGQLDRSEYLAFLIVLWRVYRSAPSRLLYPVSNLVILACSRAY